MASFNMLFENKPLFISTRKAGVTRVVQPDTFGRGRHRCRSPALASAGRKVYRVTRLSYTLLRPEAIMLNLRAYGGIKQLLKTKNHRKKTDRQGYLALG